MGFLYADGYVRVRKGGSEVRLKLSIKDVDHVKKFNDAVKSNNEIKIKGKFAISSVNQRKFVKHLVDKGCINKKSLIIKFPYFLEENLKKHFIRGYFDGDGSVSISFKKNVNFVSGSFDMLKSIGEIISFGCNVKIPEIYNYKENKFGYICWGDKNQIKSIFHYFYDNSNIFLERKKQKFINII